MIHNTQYAAGGGELATVTFQLRRITILIIKGIAMVRAAPFKCLSTQWSSYQQDNGMIFIL